MRCYGNSLVPWHTCGRTAAVDQLFAQQAIPMMWDFAEVNPFSTTGGWISLRSSRCVIVFRHAIEGLPPAIRARSGRRSDSDAMSTDRVVSTDPPYYDNIGYADLSDFFYVWLRRSLRPVFPSSLQRLRYPKAEELVATPARHGGKEQAEQFFLDGMTTAMHSLAEQAHPGAPVTIYYAFKQSETE